MNTACVVPPSFESLFVCLFKETVIDTKKRSRIKNEDILPFSAFLVDSFGRRHNYLRISLTERCNFRCESRDLYSRLSITRQVRALVPNDMAYTHQRWHVRRWPYLANEI